MPGHQPTDDGHVDAEFRTVAGYRLLRRIGEGGMSSVYLSYDIEGGCPVAVKILADHLAHSREFVGRFYREARLSRLLSHPNMVQGLAAGFDPEASKHYLILEFVDGPTTHAALARLGRFPVGVAVKIGLDIAQALSFLHSRQYVHRDVKPDNILLHPDGVAKLADMGLAKRLNDDAHLTSVSQGVGTSYYMAYEQALNANLVDGRSDIFALGATLYHLLAGEVPFPGATHEEIVRGKEEDTYCPLRHRNPEVPANLAGIIARTLARDPRLRFQSVDELAEALQATGLATRIPVLPLNDEENCGSSGSGSEAPTRADLKTPNEDDPSPTNRTPATSFFPEKERVPSPQDAKPNRPNHGSRFIMGCLAAGMVGLAGMFAAYSSYSSPPLTSHTNTREKDKPITSGLISSSPQ